MLLDERDAQELVSKVISMSNADAISVTAKGSNSSNLRFAVNSVTTSGSGDSISLDIRSTFGTKSGSATVTSLDDEQLQQGINISEHLARLSPENKEYMPPLEAGIQYPLSNEFYDSTAGLTHSSMAELVSYNLDKAESSGLNSAGYFEADQAFTAIGNSNGLFAYHDNTFARFSTTMRTTDGTGSSKVDRSYADVQKLNVRELSDKLAERSLSSQNPRNHEPGKYTVILDHAAACDMITSFTGYLSMRSADEGRSYFSRNGSNKMGEDLFSKSVNIYSDPTDDRTPARPFTDEGYPVDKISWIKQGRLENLFTSRYWAQKKGIKHIPYPTNTIMDGSDKSVEELIAETENGVFITSLWYIRAVDPKQMLLTGLTRNGVFLIKSGKLIHPVNNFRFNESPASVLSRVTDLSRPLKCVGSENIHARCVVPAIRVEEFNLSTVSEAI